MSLVDGNVCFAYSTFGLDSVSLYRAAVADATATLTTSFTAPTIHVRGVGASYDETSGEDLCWIATTVPPSHLEVLAYDSTGVRVREYSDDLGDVAAMTMLDGSSVWLLRMGQTQRILQRLEWLTPSQNKLSDLGPTDANLLLGP